MSFTIVVRDIKTLEKRLKQGLEIDSILPEECNHNFNVLFYLSLYVNRVKPDFHERVTEEERKTLCKGAAYTMRTDMLKEGGEVVIGYVPFELSGILPIVENDSEIGVIVPYFIKDAGNRVYGEDSREVHLRNNPENLHEDWRLPDNYKDRGVWMYSAFLTTWMAMGLHTKLDNSSMVGDYQIALTDSITYLLAPTDLDDYKYTKEEIERYEKILRREAKSI